ncbi:hypothetical protein [Mycobacterium terramassiliense]|uniref:hypothetical protein n=1 Tax=Mycobacterium terramassiliense TaxID=1841859 RepID=UPI0012FF5C43|nr:hypothetical protein [Mycobacterium terramassiliense]
MVTGSEPYERRVEPATAALDAFATDLTNELDRDNGGFPWWTGYSDWKTLTMIADYLIQSVSGASAALVAASFSAKVHRESSFANNSAVTAAWREIARTGQEDPHAYFAAMPRDAAARRRELNITHSAEHCFYHLGQTLDRLSAALIIVGGFGKDVATADWGTIVGTPARRGIVHDLAASADRPSVQPLGSPARQVQHDLLEALTRPDDFGCRRT